MRLTTWAGREINKKLGPGKKGLERWTCWNEHGRICANRGIVSTQPGGGSERSGGNGKRGVRVVGGRLGSYEWRVMKRSIEAIGSLC